MTWPRFNETLFYFILFDIFAFQLEFYHDFGILNFRGPDV